MVSSQVLVVCRIILIIEIITSAETQDIHIGRSLIPIRTRTRKTAWTQIMLAHISTFLTAAVIPKC